MPYRVKNNILTPTTAQMAGNKGVIKFATTGSANMLPGGLFERGADGTLFLSTTTQAVDRGAVTGPQKLSCVTASGLAWAIFKSVAPQTPPGGTNVNFDTTIFNTSPADISLNTTTKVITLTPGEWNISIFIRQQDLSVVGVVQIYVDGVFRATSLASSSPRHGTCVVSSTSNLSVTGVSASGGYGGGTSISIQRVSTLNRV